MRFLLLLFILLSNAAKAQEGFIQAYDLNDGGMSFYNMLLVEDTLVVCGGIQNLDYPQWGLFFAKLDTLGNFLEYKVHYDSLGDTYVFEQGYEMIKTEDEGYALVGQLFFRNYPILIKLDVNGDLEFVREYPDTTVLNMRHWNIVEFEHGYISTGVKQQADDYKWDAFIMRTDKTGEKVWEISYGEYDERDSFRGINKIEDNEFLITGGTSNWSGDVSSVSDLFSIPRALIIDTLGNILWEWEGELHYAGGSSSRFNILHLSNDGNWINEGAFSTIIDNDNLHFQPEIIKRDTNFNVIWSTRFGEPTSNKNNFIDLVQTPDGGWVAAGQYYQEEPLSFPPVANLSGWLAKVSAEGDSLWSRTDTVFYHPIEGSTNFLSGVIALPSGSIIACGHLNRYAPEPAKSFGWIIKVDQHGCIEPGCNPILDAVNLTPMIESVNIYPNPTSDFITVSGAENFDWRLYDVNGKLIKMRKDEYQNTEIDLTELTSGIYFVRIRSGNRMLTKKIVKN